MSYSRAMTTNELIENYGIGHNCLSDAYALGMMHGLDGMEHAVEFAEEKARADAIEEFVKALEEHQQKNWVDNLEYGITFADIEEVAEQLKEKKNGE